MQLQFVSLTYCFFFALFSLTSLPASVLAGPRKVLCASQSGQDVFLRTHCRRTETRVSSGNLLSSFEIPQQTCEPGPFGERGLQGERGTSGQKGDPGEFGDNGINPWETLPSGTTVIGAIGRDARTESVDLSEEESVFLEAIAALPAIAPTALSDIDVIVSKNKSAIADCIKSRRELADDAFVETFKSICADDLDPCLDQEEQNAPNVCTGSFEQPLAPAGVVCIYLNQICNASDLKAYGRGKYSFALGWDADVELFRDGNQIEAFSQVEGVWAYTAP